jgi:hypothetical protein
MNLGAALANDNVAGNHVFAAKLFHATALGLAVTTVSCGTCTFFVSHFRTPLQNDLVNLKPSILLPVTTPPAVPFSSILENANLFALDLLCDRRLDRCTLDYRGTHSDILAIDDHQYAAQLDLFAGLLRQQLYVQYLSRSHLVLLSTCLNNRVHATYLQVQPSK